MRLVIGLCGVALLALLAVVTTPQYAAAADGKAVFTAQKCNMCHAVKSAGIEATVKSEKMKGPDMDGIGAKHDAAWLEQYLKQETDINGKKHAKKWGGSADDLKALVDWLAAMK